MGGLGFLKTHHSYHEGTGKTAKYIEAASNRGIDKLAITDRVSLADMVKFYDHCTKNNITPIMGATFKLADPKRLFNIQLVRNSAYFSVLRNLVEEIGLPAEKTEDIVRNIFATFETSVIVPQAKIHAKSSTVASVERAKRTTLLALLESFISLGTSDAEQNRYAVTKAKLIKSLKTKEKVTDVFYANFELSNDSPEIYDRLTELFITLFRLAADYKKTNEECFSDLMLINGTQQGFQSIKNLISWSYMYGQSKGLVELQTGKRKVNSFPKLLPEYLTQSTEGVVAVIGLKNDELGKAIKYNSSVQDAIGYYREIFGDKLVIAIERSSTEEDGSLSMMTEHEFNERLLDVSEEFSIPAIAYNNALFVNEEDYEIHDVKTCIILDKYRDDVTRVKDHKHGNFLADWEHIKQRFSDLPQLVHNSENIDKFFDSIFGVDREKLKIDLDIPVLPNFPIPDGFTPTSYMENLARQGMLRALSRRFKREFGFEDLDLMPCEIREKAQKLKDTYEERLRYEVGVIDSMGFPGYFLIVSDFIVWAKSNGIPVGPGRGSGAGSLVAYGLSITNIDPIKRELLFERFLNPERVSMPDFDVDFGSGFHPETKELMTRDSVIQYTADKYNDPNALFPSVAQIATHGLIAARSGFKDVSKVHGTSVRYGDDFKGLFPDDPEVKVDDCLKVESVKQRVENEPVTKVLMELTAACEGLKKSSGMHAGGVVIANGSITNFTSVQSDVRDVFKLVTQADKSDVERAGLVKFDFLGLLNLTTMSFALRHIENRHGVKIDLDNLEMDDPVVFEMLQEANSHALFQIESSGMRELLRRIKVENIEELSALCALFRPGPLQSGMVDNFIDRKHGREEISYPDSKYQHEWLKDILKPTYGIILYQEQVMQIAQVLAGYSLGGADILRRAMGKKNPEEMAKQRDVFESGAKSKGVDPTLALKIFDLVEKFAGYGFNKSHSMAYAYIAYQTAWLKRYYPCEYMAAVLSSQADNHDKLKQTLIDCKKNGIEILPPDINKSGAMFEPEGEMSIRYGLSAIKGVGNVNLVKILNERNENGSFTTLPEIAFRCRSAFDANISKALILSGALDSLNLTSSVEIELARTPYEESLQNDVNALIKARDEVFESERSVASIKDEGMELHKMIESLTYHYGQRYNLNISDNMSIKERINLLWSFFGQVIQDNLNSSDHLYDNMTLDTVRMDFESLILQVNKRSDLSRLYIQENADYQELVNLHGDVDSLNRKIDLLNSKINEPKQNHSLDVVNNFDSINTDEHVGSQLEAYYKRPYLLHEAETMRGFKVKDFAGFKSVDDLDLCFKYDSVVQIAEKDRLISEYDRMSLFITGHPLDVGGLRDILRKRHRTTPLSRIVPSRVNSQGDIEERNIYSVAGMVEALRILKVKKQGKNFGREMAIMTLADGSGHVNVAVFPDIYSKIKGVIYINEVVCLKGTALPNTKGEDIPDMHISEVYDCSSGKVVYEDSYGGYKK
ncbi:DNA polymerase III subunit alpha [Vibrio sp. D431a]|uniref:DNA polymerase III subunit alpha n=1 Tax=Vibrio sp. D431a TaxID=2837388 RepID=UPI002554E282|nr:DNA polymerase III subunit alpha [Vibrio sp. D431a]MDK9793862.1 DNA polymerase III subunit alpha [Vibrio sp. D431a]